MRNERPILLFVVNEPYFFVSHRLPLAAGAMAEGYDVHLAAPDDNVWAPETFRARPFLADRGITHHDIPLSRWGMSPFEELATIRSLYALYRSVRPAVAHHVTAKAVLYGGVAARTAGVPAVVSAFPGLGHYFTASTPGARLVRLALIRGYGFATGHPNSWTIVQNRHDAETLRRLGVSSPGRTTVTRGSGVSLRDFRPAPWPDGPPLVVLPARMIREKGVGAFVEVARRLRSSGVRARFALVGNAHPGNPRAVPEATLRAWHAEGVVEYWGRREDMPEVFAGASVVCLPSTYGEGVPKALMEAAACGRPIVAYDVPGCRETVVDGSSGILVAEGDLGALAESLRRLIRDRALCRRMGAEGRRLAEAEFGVDRVVDQTLEIYRALRAAPETASPAGCRAMTGAGD